MPQAQVIDGKAAAEKLRATLGSVVKKLKRDHSLVPGLAVVMVGDDPASRIYTQNKVKQTSAIGMHSIHRDFPANVREAQLAQELRTLNENQSIHGILVQLPLPSHIDTNRILSLVSPEKDVDGFHPINVGRLASGINGLVPCTPQGCLLLLKQVKSDLTGSHAVIVGRSNIVGKPLAQLLLAENCSTTIVHSKTPDPQKLCSQADILVSAAGRPAMIKGSWIKSGSIVLDVGINRITTSDGAKRIVGDVAFEDAARVASAITPVPGGVGPMTIACLLRNCVKAACEQQGLPLPPSFT
ncbi:MAG: bifunctional methylenetetrahydrofolate dehydrogenase/methenyltetrahydrofolate cyclohydrolase FolD [Pseudomonadota bacterium]|nr:bifunctional methylenetetrahydrofolate dehydrogenase/methenyltetrahydrofolate cyclohydrolase FolD [Pseudomonadota bacterium]